MCLSHRCTDTAARSNWGEWFGFWQKQRVNRIPQFGSSDPGRRGTEGGHRTARPGCWCGWLGAPKCDCCGGHVQAEPSPGLGGGRLLWWGAGEPQRLQRCLAARPWTPRRSLSLTQAEFLYCLWTRPNFWEGDFLWVSLSRISCFFIPHLRGWFLAGCLLGTLCNYVVYY